MNKVTFRLPSKAVQYGYAEVELDVSGAVDFEVLGQDYARYVRQFWEGEKDIKTKPLTVAQAADMFDSVLGSTKIEETEDPKSAGPEGSAPWDNKKATTTTKPWESNNVDLF